MSEQKLPTSDLQKFEYQLKNENQSVPSEIVIKRDIQKIQKNLVISFISDATGCGHIRNVFPMSYLNACHGKEGKMVPFIAPFFLFQHDILVKARTLYFQRTMSPSQIPQIVQYKELQKKYKYKMVYDIDDFIWSGPDIEEKIPDYNYASTKIKDDVREASIKIMNHMDTVCVSTDFLKQYLENHGVAPNIVVVPNTISKYFWQGRGRRPMIREKIKKPRVIYTGSPTHYCNIRRMKGDWDSIWFDWIIKNVRDDKITFCVMGGLPWFFEPIKKKIKIVPWVNSFQYHLPILGFRPDFGIGPLVPNYFNYSKSDIKYIEYCAAGCIGIGTTFTNGKPSPYDNNLVQVTDKVTLKEIDTLFDEYTEPEVFNKVISEQYKMLDQDGRWLESKKFLNSFGKLL